MKSVKQKPAGKKRGRPARAAGIRSRADEGSPEIRRGNGFQKLRDHQTKMTNIGAACMRELKASGGSMQFSKLAERVEAQNPDLFVGATRAAQTIAFAIKGHPELTRDQETDEVSL